jgi:dTDP-glucose 4,6-dehydratase
MKLLVTGGCGFIGSNFVRHVLKARSEWEVTVFDLLTYSGNLGNVTDLLPCPRFKFFKGDIADRDAVAIAAAGVDTIVNFAAESHVDRSILEATPFVRTNILGTQVLLEAARSLPIVRFVQISTDEVYGSLGPTGRFREDRPLAPNSPYSASKAAADLLVRAYVHTHAVPAIILRSSNAYGPYQFPEKLIPLMIANALEGKPLPVYGDGLHVRDWIHVLDLCEGILQVVERGRTGEVYNVGGGNECTNLDVVNTIVELTGASKSLIRFVPDRPGHDRRYAMDFTKIQTELGWRPRRAFGEGLREAVDWYARQRAWVALVASGEYRSYYEQQYGARLAAAAPTPPGKLAAAS